MSIDKHEGLFYPTCDGDCGKALLPGEYDFPGALRVMREAKWKTIYVNDEPRNLCPGCYKKHKEEGKPDDNSL